MTDLVEQSADTSNSDDQGSVSDAGQSEYIDHQDDSEAGPEQDSQQEEDEELEVGDKKIVLPKSVAEKLKSERMMHADYTQKTQAAADERRQIAAEREQVQRQAQEHQQYLGEVAKVVAINDQLAAFEQLDWEGLISTDPVEAMRLQQQQRTLQSKREQAVQEVTNKQRQFALNEQQETAKQVQEATDYFAREIKGWSPELDNEVNKYVLGHGIPAAAVSQMALKTPAFVKLAHKAMLYDKLTSKAPAPKAPAPEAKPAARVGSNASVRKDPAKMSDKEFADWRRSQIKNRS
jgi:hypothetical protein